MKAKWKLLCLIAVAFGCLVVLTGYVRMTWIMKNTRQVTVRMPACTSNWQVCQQIALVHLSDAVNQYPASNQYQVRWSSQWLPLDDTNYFGITYNHQNQDLAEVNLGVADMNYCNPVTDRAIHLAAKMHGTFDTLTKYGAEHHPL